MTAKRGLKMNEDIKDAIQKCIDRALERRELAGCSFCLVQNGTEQFYTESGYADLAAQKPISRDSIYRLYSMSKPVTAAAMMALVEDGYIDLQDPVYRYFPSFRHQSYVTQGGDVRPVDDEHVMLIRDLMNMTSGLVYPDNTTRPGRETDTIYQDAIRRLGTDRGMTTAEFAERIGECTLLFQPGTGWNYSVSADIAGAVIERAAGMRFGDYLQERLFDPIGMKDTGFSVPERKRDRLVVAYQNENDQEGAPLIPYTGNHLAIRNDGGENAFESGGAGLFSTLDDYRLFTSMLLNGGAAENGRQILRPGTVRYLTGGKLDRQQQEYFDRWRGLSGHTYANFNRVMTDPAQAVTIGHKGEYGWDGWLGVYFSNDPECRQTMLLMLNQKDYGTHRLTRQLRNIVNSR